MTDQSPLAPEKYLTGAEWELPRRSTRMVQTVLDGGTIDNFDRGGLPRLYQDVAAGPAVTDAALQPVSRRTDGRDECGGLRPPTKGPLMSNTGRPDPRRGQVFPRTDIALESMD